MKNWHRSNPITSKPLGQLECLLWSKSVVKTQLDITFPDGEKLRYYHPLWWIYQHKRFILQYKEEKGFIHKHAFFISLPFSKLLNHFRQAHCSLLWMMVNLLLLSQIGSWNFRGERKEEQGGEKQLLTYWNTTCIVKYYI